MAANRDRRALVALVHDVGKYISRTSRNLKHMDLTELDPDLLRLLIDDLYALDGKQRASLLFDQRKSALGRLKSDTRIADCEKLLKKIDALEADVRAGSAEAIEKVVDWAVQIDQSLRALLARFDGRS